MLKIGDKVKMTPRGFKYHSNLDKAFDVHSVGKTMEQKHFTRCVCELFAIHGVGTIRKFNFLGEPEIRWEYSLDGVKYHYIHYYELKDVKKLNILDKIKLFLKGEF
jgi:hypothetical protein